MRCHQVRCIADEATTTHLERGTALRFVGENYDPTEGIGGDVFTILEGPFAGDFLYLGTGGRFGDPSWAAGYTRVPSGSRHLEDPVLAEELLSLMQAVAIEHGAPGYGRSTADGSRG